MAMRMPKPKYQFTHLTAVPGLLASYFSGGVVGRAVKNGIVNYREINLHDFGRGKYKAIDDTPYGGGPGMVMRVEPIFAALKKIKRSKKTRVILFEASGKLFTQADSRRYAKNYNHLVFISGRYEGVDARVHKLVDERVSIGAYVLSGGELAATVVMDSVSRLIPNVLGKYESLVEESYNDDKLQHREAEHYTHPEFFSPKKGTHWKVPKVLLSGNHRKIGEWRREGGENRK
jgi:tRNA (guanine37-N1)-methyltransferase